MKRITRSAIVEHPAGELYALVEDIESYPQFLPWCRSARVRERSAGRTVTPDSFTHGSSADRQRWLSTGLRSGDPGACDTFN